MARQTKDEKEFIALGWKLLTWKVTYYRPEAVHTSRINDVVVSDEDYDAAELRYLTLLRKLRDKNGGEYPFNTIVHKGWPGFEEFLLPPHSPMMEIDDTRPSVQLVLKKLGSIK